MSASTPERPLEGMLSSKMGYAQSLEKALPANAVFII